MSASAARLDLVTGAPSDFDAALKSFADDARRAGATRHMKTLTVVTTCAASPVSRAVMDHLDLLLGADAQIRMIFGPGQAGPENVHWVNQWRRLAKEESQVFVKIAQVEAGAYETMLLGRIAIWVGDELTGVGYDAEADDFMMPSSADWPVQATLLREFVRSTCDQASPLG